MSERVFPLSENQPTAQDPVRSLSGGAMLRKAREAQGLHIAALAVSLKVPVRKLEALETERFDLLPDIVFVRALASSVCRTLKIDPVPVLAQLPHTAEQSINPKETGINVPFRASRDGAGLSFWAHLSKPLVLAVLLLLAGALVLGFFPFLQFTKGSSAPKPEVVNEISPLPAPAPPIDENPAPAAGAASDRISGMSASGSDALIAMNPMPPDRPASLLTPAFTVLPVAVHSLDPATETVVFKARGLSWVEVVDASGVVQLRKTLANGEIAGASGVIPLSVVVGRADTTEVQVRGKSFDLTHIKRDNVARFEVKK